MISDYIFIVQRKYQTRADKDKPRNLELGLRFMDFFFGLRITQGYQLDHSFLDNVSLELGGLPNVLPLAVHLFFFVLSK